MESSGALGNPAVCSMTCSTVIASLPCVANSGTSSTTRSAASIDPSPISNHIIDATMGFVAEKTQNRESPVAVPNVSNARSSPSRSTAS